MTEILKNGVQLYFNYYASDNVSLETGHGNNL